MNLPDNFKPYERIIQWYRLNDYHTLINLNSYIAVYYKKINPENHKRDYYGKLCSTHNRHCLTQNDGQYFADEGSGKILITEAFMFTKLSLLTPEQIEKYLLNIKLESKLKDIEMVTIKN